MSGIVWICVKHNLPAVQQHDREVVHRPHGAQLIVIGCCRPLHVFACILHLDWTYASASTEYASINIAPPYHLRPYPTRHLCGVDGALEHHLCLLHLVQPLQHQGQVVGGHPGVLVLGAQHGGADANRMLIQLRRLLEPLVFLIFVEL